jgi:hypothetical protein
MVGRSDESVNELRELLHLSETANDEKMLDIINESKIQVMLKLRKNRWTKVSLIWITSNSLFVENMFLTPHCFPLFVE